MKTNCPELTNMVKGFVAAGNGFALLYLVPMNSFYKEISYRGVMQNEVRNAKLPIWVAILIPVLMYCSLLVISGNVIGVLLYAFFGHILFGTIYYLGKSLWSTIIAQTVCTFSLVFIKHNVHKSFFTNQHSIIASALCIILLVVLMGILVKNSRSQSQGSVTNNNPAVNQ
jgi:membrane protease YdiL (CAAX protease family)